MSDTNGVELPSRTIPWPPSISPEGRRSLEILHQTQLKGDLSYPPLEDKDAWRDYVAAVDAVLLERSAMYAVSSRPGIKSETIDLDGVTVHVATPENLAAEIADKIFLEMHGGGLIYLRGEGTRRGSLREAERLGVTTMSIDFRVPPDFPYPAALDDCVAAYAALLKQKQPSQIIVGGISGGGNLAAAMLLRARDEGLPMPAACILLTPEIDLTESGDTFETLLGLDPVLNSKLTTQIAAYAGTNDLHHPYLSPLFGDFSRGFPPTFLQSGTRDMFLSNTVRFHRALRSAGIPAELNVWEGMPHGSFMGAPEDDEVALEMRRFMDRHWGI